MHLKSIGFNEYHLKDARDTIHFVSKISGRPVIFLLHGFGVDGINQYYRTAVLLSRDFDVVVPDLFFFGYSSTSDTSYSLDMQVRMIEKIVHSLKIDSHLIFVGNSYGGMVSTLYSRQNKEKVDMLFIYDSPLMFYTIAQADSISKAFGIEGVDKLLCPVTPEELRKSLSFVFYRPPYVPKFILTQMINFPNLNPREKQLKLLFNMDNEAKRYNHFEKEQLPDIRILWGANDVFIPPSVAYALKEYWHLPDEHLYLFPKSSHVANFEHPRKFSKVVKSMILLR